MSIFIERSLETEVGEIRIAITRADHVSVEGQPEIRGSKFNAHLHFYRQPDGTYDVRESDHLSMRRAWESGGNNRKFSNTAPPTYLAKVLDAYRKAVNAHAKAHPEDFVVAENKDIERDIEAAERKVTDARIAVIVAEAELNTLLAKQKAHKRTHALPDEVAADMLKDSEAAWNLNPRETAHLRHIRDRFIEERVRGYLDSKGQKHAPISRLEAVRQWLAEEHEFKSVFNDPEVRQKLKLD